MSEKNIDEEGGKVRYEPLPSIYTAFAAGASGPQSIAETVDNSIDHVRSHAYIGSLPDEAVPDALEVTISYEEENGDKRVIIEDNAGGVEREELARFFQLGRSDTPPNSIGRFGVGAKRLIALGNKISYQSRYWNADSGWGFDVDADDFDDVTGESNDDVYESDRYRVDDLEPGRTRIVVSDLRTEWADMLGEEVIEGKRDKKDLETVSDISDGSSGVTDDTLLRFSGIYASFIESGIDIGGGDTIPFSIKLIDDTGEYEIPPLSEVEFSYLPFDGLGPRTYVEIPFDSVDNRTGEEETVRADITVGLMPTNVVEKSGLTVSMNGRNVIFRSTDNDMFSTRYLGNFDSASGHARLVCKIDLQGPARVMPWNDLKTALDPTKDVTSRLLSVAANALEPYRSQSYTALPAWILSSYPQSSVYATDGGKIKKIDKSNSKTNRPRFNDKPGEGVRGRSWRRYPQRDRLHGVARLHAELRIIDESVLSGYETPAYNSFLSGESEYEALRTHYASYVEQDEFTPDREYIDGPEDEDLEPREGIDSEHYDSTFETFANEDHEIPVIEDIISMARRHANKGVRATADTEGIEPWQIPRYDEELKRALGHDSLDELDELDKIEPQPPEDESEVEGSVPSEAPESTQANETGTTASRQPTSSDSEFEASSTSSPTSFGDSSGDTSTESDPSTSDSKQRDLAESGVTQGSTSDTEPTTDEIQNQMFGSTGSSEQAPSTRGDSPLDDDQALVIKIPEGRRSDFFDYLGVSEDKDADEIGERIFTLVTGESDSEEDQKSIDAVMGDSVRGQLSTEQRDEVLEVLNLDEDATAEEFGGALMDLVDRYKQASKIFDI